MAQIQKAVIDRIEDGKIAVLFIGEEERRFNVPLNQLPRGVKEGDWLKIELEGQEILKADIDKEETAKRLQRIREKLARLRGKSQS